MKQRFYVVIENKKPIEPKDVLFAISQARPDWGRMSASLAAQQLRAADLPIGLPGCTCGGEDGHHPKSCALRNRQTANA